MSATTKEREEFVATMVREFPNRRELEVIDWCRKLMRAGATHCRLAVTHCNRDMTPQEERSDERCQDRIQKLAAEFGCGVRLQGDPRGATVKLLLPSKRTNDWGQTGWCVPGS